MYYERVACTVASYLVRVNRRCMHSRNIYYTSSVWLCDFSEVSLNTLKISLSLAINYQLRRRNSKRTSCMRSREKSQIALPSHQSEEQEMKFDQGTIFTAISTIWGYQVVPGPALKSLETTTENTNEFGMNESFDRPCSAIKSTRSRSKHTLRASYCADEWINC